MYIEFIIVSLALFGYELLKYLFKKFSYGVQYDQFSLHRQHIHLVWSGLHVRRSVGLGKNRKIENRRFRFTLAAESSESIHESIHQVGSKVYCLLGSGSSSDPTLTCARCTGSSLGRLTRVHSLFFCCQMMSTELDNMFTSFFLSFYGSWKG